MPLDANAPALSGRFVGYGLPDLLGFLAMTGAVGEMDVRAEEGELAIYWIDGQIVSARAGRGGVRIGDLLVRRARVRPEDVDAAVSSARKRNVLIGKALVELGFISEEALAKVLAEQVFENLYRIFQWRPSEFRFLHGMPCPPESAHIRVDVQNLLLEGARRCDEWALMPPSFSDPEEVFEVVPDPDGQERISLTLEEWKILFLLNGRRRLREIWRESPFGSDLETSRSLFGLSSAKLVRIVPRSELEKNPLDERPRPESSVSIGDSSSFKIGGRRHRPETAAPTTAMPLVAVPALVPDLETEKTKILSSAEIYHRDQIDVRSVGRLVSVDDEAEAKAFELEADIVTLGRGFDNHLVLANPHVSSHHARIVRKDDLFFLEDTGSHNGVFVEGQRVTSLHLKGGEEIEIYPYRFRFEIGFSVSELEKPEASGAR